MRPLFCSVRAADRVVVLTAGCVVAAVLLGVVGVSHTVPVWLLWPAAIAATGTAAVSCAIAAATGDGPVRTFWRRLTVATCLLCAGGLSNLYDIVTGVGAAPASRPVSVALYVAALSTAALAFVVLRGRRRTRRATVALCLDAAVVAVGAGLVAVQALSMLPMRVSDHLQPLFVFGAVTVVVLAVIRVGMAGAGPVPGRALWMLTAIGALGPLSAALATPLQAWPHLNTTVVVLLPAALLFAEAARTQTRVNMTPPAPAAQQLPRDRGTRPGVWRRSISPVPYTAVAVTVSVLVGVTLHTGYLRPGLAGGSVALIVLVVIRQLVALADNTELLDRLAEQAGHDDLTGLPNRRLFTSTLNQRTAPTTVAVCDLDDFAALNDRIGDAGGDAILREAAARLTLTVGGDAVVARLLGDEFGVLVPEHHPLADGPRLADALLHAFRTPLRVEDRDLLVTVTAGVATAQGGTVPDLLRRAELGLQAAERAGRDRYREYTPDLDTAADHHAHLAAALRRGLDLGEFRLVYQPIVELPHGSVVGVEALVRWHPDGEPAVSPAEFIPVAEHTGLIVDLGAWIIDTACADAAAWQRTHGADVPWVSVNVSARQLLDPELPTLVAAALQRHGLDPARLTLEITETAVFAGGAALAAVQALRDLGVGIALDDFGTGHSSLTLLRTCPVTTLKVDKSFIDELNGTAQQEAIAVSLSGIASTLGLRAVAEGVESPAQADRLHALGYRYAQGFHFARPTPAAQIDALLAGRPAARPATPAR
ncbi:putative bifunctional diguanylate cyclase/phosphodiesterase [Actinoplanes sp. NPDC049681]|uniref:putative bifunctional diguanylate cyclase/phosphodiesterase n=1 Tax=Actinoplanes sp. NPDC049681 TaxID=3363905 RepID=UPI003799BC79